MSIPQLQRAALAPFLWRRHISKNVIQDFEQFRDGLEESPPQESNIASESLIHQNWCTTGDAFIVPGGRFVISAAMEEKGSIDLFDLGSPRDINSEKSRMPVVSKKIGLGESVTLSQFCVVPQGRQGLRSVLAASRFDADAWV